MQARDACPYVSEMLQIINTDLDTQSIHCGSAHSGPLEFVDHVVILQQKHER